MSDNVLELREVSKLFGTFKAVDGVSLAVPRGSVYGFLGPNGAGKTTTIRIVLDIFKPSSGSLEVLGAPSALQVRERIGYLPEEKGLYKKMKAWAIVAYFASLKGVGRKEAKRRAYELLERYGLKDFANHKTEALSKGMGQKVQVLASVAHDPELVILDEPFSGLDPVNQEVLEELIQDLKARGKTVIFSTHVMSHAERICDRVLIIAKGRKVFDGSVPEARSRIPRTIRIQTGDDVAPLRELLGADGVRRPAPEQQPDHWELRLRNGVDPENVLQTCFQNHVRLRSFDQSEPSLHDVFVHLVGEEAREATLR